MNLVKADAQLAQQFAADIPELVHATGPVSYDYHFHERSVFDALVARSWLTPGTLFSAEATTLAIADDELLGILISFHGPQYRERVAALNVVWPDMIAAGECAESAVPGIIERSEHAHWLNPAIRSHVYYVHALSVKPEHRGKQIGVALLTHAMQEGQRQGLKALELDVLSDNPAVHFYSAMGLELLVESRAPKPEAYGVPPEWRMGKVFEEV